MNRIHIKYANLLYETHIFVKWLHKEPCLDMSNSYFRFKQFTVQHDKCAMKVGTDGVLLGAWSAVESAGRILDVGTGTGLVALMLAQRSEAIITALEIDVDAVSQAKENIAGSPWKDRIEVVHSDFRTYFPEERFELIVSNPPYFIDSLECPEEQRTMARHNSSLTYSELLEHAASLLLPEGRFCVIIPSDALEGMNKLAECAGLYLSKQMNVITTPGKQPKRVLLEYVLDAGTACITEDLLIEEKRHQYSPEYIALTKAFYLNF